MSDPEEVVACEIDRTQITVSEKVGDGSTAEVFRGSFGGRDIAIKQMNWHKGRMAVLEQRAFDREVGIMPRIKHPNLVQIIGVASLEKPFLIITEYCAGGCCFELLHNMIDEVPLSWPQQHKMCTDVALAMDYLHRFEPQIIHRDLKSLNLLLMKEIKTKDDIPVVKISDFGIARMKDKTEGEWGKMTVAAGTCTWMAPEVFVGSKYDEKVDVYSYGMILFEIICREVPFGAEETQDVGKLTIQGGRPDLEAVPQDCPETLRDLMIFCWAHDPKKRPSFEMILPMLAEVAGKGFGYSI